MIKKLKEQKQQISLKDGRELHVHTPRKPEETLDLKSYVDPSYKRIEVEIGCGKGEFIANRAPRFPDTFFIGIDKRQDRHDLTLKKLAITDAKNYRILRVDARSFMSHALPEISMLHVYHPDPWPKARHHKHRFFRSPDAKVWAEAIVPGGELRISTDHREYYEEIIDIVESWNLFTAQIQWSKRSGTPLTHFEKIFLSKQEPVFKVHFTKNK